MEDLLGERGLLRQGPYLEELNRRVLAESGSIRILGGFTNSFRLLFTKTRCVKKMEDLKGIKIRIPKNPVMEKMWRAWGGSTYPIDWNETFGAVAQGVVDAFDSPLDVILKMGFHQHIKYVNNMHFLPQAALLIVNDAWFRSLSKADQALIVNTAAENDRAHYAYVQETQKTLRQTLESKHAITFCDLDDEAAWKKRVETIWPEFYGMIGGGEAWVKKTVAYKATGKLD
jgi:TRAP-type C4-dicarboxylate transport system substrate-binding protein